LYIAQMIDTRRTAFRAAIFLLSRILPASLDNPRNKLSTAYLF